MTPLYIGDRSRPARMMSCVRAFVCVVQHGICAGCMAASPRNENTGTGSVSPCCSSRVEKSIERPSMTRRGARLQPSHRQREFGEAGRQRQRCRVACPPGYMTVEPDVHLAVQERSCRQDDASRREACARRGDDTGDPPVRDDQIVGRLLEQRQPGLVLEPASDRRLIQHPVRLDPRGSHGGTLAAVEDAELDARLVGGKRHRTTERIDLLDEVTLADSADRRVAAHRAQRLDVVRQQQGSRAHAGRGQCRFGAGVAATDHDDVEMVGESHGSADQEEARLSSHRGPSATAMFHVEQPIVSGYTLTRLRSMRSWNAPARDAARETRRIHRRCPCGTAARRRRRSHR